MFQELKFQFSTAILTIVTLAAGVAAFINFQQQERFRLPDDGVIWVDRQGGVEALSVPAGSEGNRAGLRDGDRIKLIHGVPIEKAVDVAQVLAGLGSWKKATYTVVRGGVEFPINVIVGEVPLDHAVVYQYLVGLAYLIIGLFVYFRRASAHKARHFYILCLSSFIFFCFHYTGKLNSFDEVIYYGNLAAGLLAPAVFVHFCLSFPEPRKWLQSGAHASLIYLPALVLFVLYVAFAAGVLTVSIPLVELRWVLDRVWVVLSTVPYVIGGITLSLAYRKAEDPIVRQQLKWLRNGTFCGILPFGVFYILPYALGAIPERVPEDVGALAAADSADSRLRHRALPADGRGHPVPARLRLHAGHALRAGGILCDRVFARFGGPEELQRPRQYWAHHGDVDHRLPVPADPQLDPGTPGQVFLSRSVRLPPHPG